MFRTALALATLLTISGCAAQPSDATGNSAQDISDGLGAEASRDWQAYVTEATAAPLQDGCAPYSLPSSSDQAYRGTVLLLHGYSACPQQYAEIAKELSAEGYTVLVPLLPGHGHAYTVDASGKATDHTEQLITDANYGDYGVFAKRMADIVAKAAPGDHAVMGLSVGGAIAASAAEQSPGTFKRVLLMNAFFEIANGFGAAVVPVLSAIVPQFPYGWGDSCEAQRSTGRAGICQFEVTNLRAVQHFGEDTLKNVASIHAKVQVVGVEDDPAASDSAIAQAATKIAGSSACFFEKGVPHSLFSPQDNPNTDMYWLPSALEETRDFIGNGQSFATAEASSVSPYARCRAR
jgi:alpha-beta hydrolase superfamily lysophospholipase